MKNTLLPRLAAPFITLSIVAPSFAFAKPVELPVPYIMQVPDGNWVAPWDEACEEATTVMIDAYYDDRESVPLDEARQRMQAMIDWENETFKNYQDTDAAETVRFIEEHSDFRASIKRDPSVDDIKTELNKGRPVIFLVDMYEFYREQPLGDSYHVGVITGYDDETNEFIVNDPGRETKRYPYDVLMDALGDFNKQSKEADGTPTVIFTAPPKLTLQKFLQQIIAMVRGWF